MAWDAGPLKFSPGTVISAGEDGAAGFAGTAEPDAAVVGGTTMMDVWPWPEVSGSDAGPGDVVASSGVSSNPGPNASDWVGLISAGLLGL